VRGRRWHRARERESKEKEQIEKEKEKRAEREVDAEIFEESSHQGIVPKVPWAMIT
jgi:hypothetical protein